MYMRDVNRDRILRRGCRAKHIRDFFLQILSLLAAFLPENKQLFCYNFTMIKRELEFHINFLHCN
jgi:hypothetical protein